MGIGPIALLIYSHMLKEKVMVPGQKIMELGSQDVMAHPSSISLVYEALGMKPRTFGDKMSSRELMEDLGFRYECIDIDGRHGAHAYDLNDALTFYEEFDIVTNHGTTEHCFNQQVCFANIHKFCKVGGIMVHLVPSSGYRGHCFYRYDPIMFDDLAAANGYGVVGRWATLDNVPKFTLYPWLYLDAGSQDVLLVIILRKLRNAAFVVPIQSRYKRLLQLEEGINVNLQVEGGVNLNEH